jgi:hypothetical protein
LKIDERIPKDPSENAREDPSEIPVIIDERIPKDPDENQREDLTEN